MEEDTEDMKIRKAWLYFREQFKDSQPIMEEHQYVEEVIQDQIPFERRGVDLSMTTFDETPSETMIDDMKEQYQETLKELIVEEIILETNDDQEEVVLKSKVPFERKRLDLSIYTFDEPPMERMEDQLQEEFQREDPNKYWSNPGRRACMWVIGEAYEEEVPRMRILKTKHHKNRLKLKKVKNKLKRMKAKITKMLSSSISPLKRTHWNNDKRSRGLIDKP
jgi:hypothetical protein